MRLQAKVAAYEIDEQEVRLAVVKTGSALPVVLELHAAPVQFADPDDRFEAIVSALQAVAEKVKSRPSVHVLCAGSMYGVARNLTLPFKGQRRIASTVKFELEPYLAFSVDDLVVDHTTIREIDGQTEVLVVGMRHVQLEEQIAALNAAGIDPEGVNIDAAGLTALWVARQKTLTGLNAVFHARNGGSILAITYNKSLAFFRHLNITAAQIQEAPEAAAGEVQNSLRAFQATWTGEDEVGELALTGVELFPDDRMRFEESVSIPVRYEPLLEGIKGQDLVQQADIMQAVEHAADDEGDATVPGDKRHNAWESAIGVATAAAGGSFAFQFRKDELARPQAIKGALVHGVFSTVLAVLLLGLYVVYCITDYRRNEEEIDRIGSRVWELYTASLEDMRSEKERSPNDRAGRLTYEAMQSDIENNPKLREIRDTSVFNKTPLLDVLAVVARAMPEDKVDFTAIQTYPSGDLRISGVVKDPESFSGAVAELNQSPLIQVNGDAQRSNQGGQETFTIQARILEKTHGDS
jgi:hypothetical protein